MEMLALPAIAIVLATIAIDRTRAYRIIPVILNRLRRRRGD